MKPSSHLIVIAAARRAHGRTRVRPGHANRRLVSAQSRVGCAVRARREEPRVCVDARQSRVATARRARSG